MGTLMKTKKVYSIIHNAEFENCSYIIGIFEKEVTAIAYIEKNFSKYKKLIQPSGYTTWEGCGEYISISGDELHMEIQSMNSDEKEDLIRMEMLEEECSILSQKLSILEAVVDNHEHLYEAEGIE